MAAGSKNSEDWHERIEWQLDQTRVNTLIVALLVAVLALLTLALLFKV